MITIGSRKELAGISDEFKNVWITFIRKFKRDNIMNEMVLDILRIAKDNA